MTRKQLETYPYLKAQIERLKAEIECLKGDWVVTGAVKASQKHLPYALREVIVGAQDTPEENLKLIAFKRMELNRAIIQKGDVENFIKSVEDLRMKEILTRRCFYGETWKEVTTGFGCTESEDSVRMAYYRFFQ